MEVYLSEEAIESFSALQCGPSGSNPDGFLIGHKRGRLFFIEKIFPSRKGFFSSAKEYFAMKEKLDDRILGFYTFQTTDSKLKKILSPMAYGKVFMRFDRNKKDRWVIKSFFIEQEKDFFLLPINIKSEI